MSEAFMPQGTCLQWQPDILLLDVLSDGAIALACFSIPLAIAYFVRHRTGMRFKWIFNLAAIFVVAFGITHLLEIWVVWNPDYWTLGVAKAATAAVSVYTAVVLWPLMPRAIALPSPAQMRLTNEFLEDEIGRRKRMQQQLEQLNVELERRVEERTRALARSNTDLETFAYHASHELKEPLRAVRQLVRWIAVDIGGAAEGRVADSLRLLQSRLSHMEVMLDDLLIYSQVGNPQAVAAQAQIRITDLVSDVIELAAIPDSFEVSVDVGCEDHTVTRMPLQRTLLNLVNNAVNHHDRGEGAIGIRVRETGDMLEISVKDDGPGIAPEHQIEIFNIFHMLDSCTEAHSSGLGLAIVKKAVESVGGSISLNTSPGAGCRFTITWPYCS